MKIIFHQHTLHSRWSYL